MPNANDAIPTMGFAITAYKRSKGDVKSPYWKNYSDAIQHFSRMHGPEAAQQLQQIAVETGMSKGDLNDDLTRIGKTIIDTKKSTHPTILNMLAMAKDGQKPLEKVTYAFDLPETITPSTPPLPERLAKLVKR